MTTGVRDNPYIGLSNQGATCYMNSMLQTLFMTPDVREHIYSYRYDATRHGSKEYCIPYQLQRLFAKLQLAPDTYTGTTDLTKSFHWAKADSYQ